MTVQFPSPLSAPTIDAPSPPARRPENLMVAPISLTPLSPPASGQPSATVPAAATAPVSDFRQTYFGELHRQLLDQLVISASRPDTAGTAASVLPPALRSDCTAVLQVLANPPQSSARPPDDAGGAS